MSINWKVRFKNPVFITQLGIAIFLPILAYFGLDGKDITSWKIFLNLLWQALGNPYMLLLIAGSVWNTLNDPTTHGIGDSLQVMGYTKPSKKGSK